MPCRSARTSDCCWRRPFATGPLRAATAAELLRTGHHEVLIGQPETDWLDVKGRLYELDEVGSFLLARDVAAFANAAGGVIAIGPRTSQVRGAGRHQPLAPGSARRGQPRQAPQRRV
jgi:hypothetical protein